MAGSVKLLSGEWARCSASRKCCAGWIKTTNFLQEEFWKSLRAFEEQRAELMATLLALTPEEWSRNAYVVDMLGGVFERSVQWYAEGIARHERPHLRQIHKIVAAIRP